MSAATRCKKCGDELAGKLGCERCLHALSDKYYLEYQRQFLPEILSNRYDVTLVYVPAGHNGQRTREWHLQRIGDPRHAFCGAALDEKYRKDRCSHDAFRGTIGACARCGEVLDKLIATTDPSLLPERHPAPVIPIGAPCSD